MLWHDCRGAQKRWILCRDAKQGGGQRFPAGDAGGRRRGDGMGGSAHTAGNCTFKNRSGVCRDAG